MVPIIALIGRYNVGKSTLFNRLTRSYDALVANFPGLTRDRKYGHAKIENCKFICVDTGGIDETKDSLENSVTKQTLLAIKEADILLFIVDARSGLMPADCAIAKLLRSYKKSTFLVVNKTDGIDADQAIADFWSLGLDKIYPVSASHGWGVTSLLKTALLPFIDKVSLLRNLRDNDELKNSCNLQNLPIKLVVVGRPNVGKSTLINRLLSEERVVVDDIPGTTRDSIYIPMQYNNREYVLIDTAGVRKRGKIIDIVEKNSVIKTLIAIRNANVALLMIDAKKGISLQDLSLLNFILNSGRPLVIVINKWDSLNNQLREEVKKNLNYRLSFINFVRIHFISALYGSGMSNLFKSVCEAYDASIRRQSTPMLTRIMNKAVIDHHPPLVGGYRVKLKYAHAGGYNPPIIVIHGNQVKDLPDFYKRYLMNYFRKSLNIIGTPIRIQFKEGRNPFVNKQNIHTLN